MSAASRRKGAAAELEVVNLARAAGFAQARRAFASGAQGGADLTGVPPLAIEVKRTERLDLPAAWRQAVAAAAPGEIPTVIHRSSRQPWLATLPADELLALVWFRGSA